MYSVKSLSSGMRVLSEKVNLTLDEALMELSRITERAVSELHKGLSENAECVGGEPFPQLIPHIRGPINGYARIDNRDVMRSRSMLCDALTTRGDLCKRTATWVCRASQ